MTKKPNTNRPLVRYVPITAVIIGLMFMTMTTATTKADYMFAGGVLVGMMVYWSIQQLEQKYFKILELREKTDS